MILPARLASLRLASLRRVGPRGAALAVMGAALLLGACDREVILPGERQDVRSVISPDGPAIEGQVAPTTTALRLPAVRANADWTHRGGSAAHVSGNESIAGGTTPIWAAAIGQPSDRRHRVVADPVVAGGMIYTLDSRTRVTATTAGGQTAWATDLTPSGERGASVSGGGLAYDAGRLFVTTGYGELDALDPRTGAVLWRQRVDAPISGAPTAAGGTVYITDRSATGWAVRAEDGRTLWTVSGVKDIAGWMGVSAPAVSGDTVIFPFNSGQVLAVDRESGLTRWAGNVAGTRPGRAIASIRDMTGDPVISGNTVVAGTSSGSTAAFDLTTGAQLWRANQGSLDVTLVVGNAVFTVSDEGHLIRLDLANGGTVWDVPLPGFVSDNTKRRTEVWVHRGPVLAGSKLYVASSDGMLRVFDPNTGALIGQGAIAGGAASAPVVAGATLYVAGRDGKLYAFR